MMRKIIYSLALLAVIGSAALYFINGRDRASLSIWTAANPPEKASTQMIAAPGRVEPISEEIRVGAEITGKLSAVLVEEGQRVQKGQMVATLENGEYRAQVASAEAHLAQAEAQLRRVINGARDQERLEALAEVQGTEAKLKNARLEWERRQSLYRTGDIAREEAERAERDYQAASAAHDAAVQRHSLVTAQAREEDRAKAEADVALARGQLAEAHARLEKTFIHSPLTGVVLRKYLRVGESISVELTNMAIMTVADVSILRVRVDVDEADVAKLRVGQRAYVTAEAFGERKFAGHVVRIGQALGKKNIRTDEPTERVDTKILETLVELDEARALPLGLRVNAFIECSAAEHGAGSANSK